jgi:hypothetical protein
VSVPATSSDLTSWYLVSNPSGEAAPTTLVSMDGLPGFFSFPSTTSFAAVGTIAFMHCIPLTPISDNCIDMPVIFPPG